MFNVKMDKNINLTRLKKRFILFSNRNIHQIVNII